ncbi:hypothetical protein C8J57DRAFT_1511657 [Mycena rebaudengoi]|nr:hypothetical protein C8J57DRAFT_1511657 [Mycena rebaudengoi]
MAATSSTSPSIYMPIQSTGGDGFRPTINEAELTRLLTIAEQQRPEYDYGSDGGDTGMEVDTDPFGAGEPSWARQFDPALLQLPRTFSPTSPAARHGFDTNDDNREGGSATKGTYAPPSQLFQAFGYMPTPSSSADSSTTAGSGPPPRYPFTFSSPLPERTPNPYSSTPISTPISTAPTFSFPPPPPPPAVTATAASGVSPAVAATAASFASRRAAARPAADPSNLGKQGRDIILAVLADGTSGARAASGAANFPSASNISTANVAATATIATAAITAPGRGNATISTTTGSAPTGSTPSPPRPISTLPAAVPSGRRPPVPQPLPSYPDAIHVDIREAISIKDVNQVADAAISKRTAEKKAKQDRLRNPSGGTDLVVVPLPPRERKRKEFLDGTKAVMPRKRTRKEIEDDKVEARMLARRDPDKERSPTKMVRGAKASGSKATNAVPKRRATRAKPN